MYDYKSFLQCTYFTGDCDFKGIDLRKMPNSFSIYLSSCLLKSILQMFIVKEISKFIVRNKVTLNYSLKIFPLIKNEASLRNKSCSCALK